MRTARFIFLMTLGAMLCPAQWVNLIDGPSLRNWQVVGDGVWSVLGDGTLSGQRDPRIPNERPHQNQSWLYTKKEFTEFDLHVEYWLPLGVNSGVSIRDTSRARYSFGDAALANPNKTPAHVGYEIQIINERAEKYPTGSVYLFAVAKTGFQHDFDWNSLDIESRKSGIRVKLNGHLVSESAGDSQRSLKGPIGLQLHDLKTVILFRNIRIHEIGGQ
ncbi:MAG TPA: DUF1080 domain-containing protein [Bryobacteraceae bacterium]|jgi:hypothetical protein|nr:DUF1080 domain-containing protein [Bryobacteraceae bacterium]